MTSDLPVNTNLAVNLNQGGGMSGNPSMKANLPLDTKPVRPNQGGG